MSPARRPDRRRTAIVRSKALRIGPVLAVAAVAGYLVGGCAGDGSGLPALSGATDLPSVSLPTRPIRTETEPDTTEEAPTTTPEPTTSEEAPTTLPEPTTSEEAPTVPATTTTETETEPTTSTEPATTSTGEADTTTTEDSDDDGIWGWVALGAAIAGSQPDTVTATTTAAATTTAPETETVPTESVVPEPTSSESDTPWGWIALILGAAAAGGVGFLVWRRRRKRRGDASV